MSVEGCQVHTCRRRARKTAAGQATIELALVVMLLALLLAGVADVARIFSEQLAVVNAAGVAARWSTLEPTNKGCTYPSPYSAEADVVAADLGPALASQVTSVETSPGSNPSSVTVRITYRHTFLFGIIRNVPSTFTGSATMPGVVSTPVACYSVPLPTSTLVPTFTPVPTRTPIPTNTPVPPTATPTARLFVTTPVANKQNGNNNRVYIRVTVTDGTTGVDGVTLSAIVGATSATGTWSYSGNGVYTLCPSNNNHDGDAPAVLVTASKAGYQNGSGSTTAANANVCPP